MILLQSSEQVSTGREFTEEERGVGILKRIFNLFFLSCLIFFCSQFLRNIMTFFSTIFSSNNVSGGTRNGSPSMNVTVHHSQQVSDMSQLSTTSVVEGLRSVGIDIKTSLDSGLGKIEECLKEFNQCVREGALHNSQRPLLLTEKYRQSSMSDGVDASLIQVDVPSTKSVYIEFEIIQPDGEGLVCRILPPKDFMTVFGKGKRLSEPKYIPSDSLQMLVASAWKTFLNGDRVIVPVLLQWDSDGLMEEVEQKDNWLDQCRKWFKDGNNKEKNSACAIVHLGSHPVFVIFSYDFVTASLVKPKVTAFVSEKKSVPGKFPWEALGLFFMELMSVRECVESDGMTLDEVEYKTVAFLDQVPSRMSEISSLSKFHENDFNIGLPRESWKVNDFSLCVYSVAIFCSKNVSGKMGFPQFNIFKDFGDDLVAVIKTHDANLLRLALCRVLYKASLKLVRLGGAKMLTDAYGNNLEDTEIISEVIDTLDTHVLAYLAQSEGKILHFSFYA